MDNKLLVGLSAIGSQQAAATQRTNEAINQILDYCVTYPADRILYCSSDMVLCAHYDAGLTKRAKEAAELELTFSFLKNIPCPNGTDLL